MRTAAILGRGESLPGQDDVTHYVARGHSVVVWFLDPAGNRTAGTFTAPRAPVVALESTVVGPR